MAAADLLPVPGGTVILRDPADVPARHRRTVHAFAHAIGLYRLSQILAAARTGALSYAALRDEIDLTRAEEGLLDQLGAAVVVAFVDEWTLVNPLPATVEEFLVLPEDLRDALEQATRVPGAAMLAEVR